MKAMGVVEEPLGDAASAQWGFDAWLEPQKLHSIIAEPFERTLTDSQPHLKTTQARQSFLYALGKNGSRNVVVSIMRSMPLLEALSTEVWNAAQTFVGQMDMIATTLKERNRSDDDEEEKGGEEDEEIDFNDPKVFATQQPRTLTYGPSRLHQGNLRETLGTPATDGLAAMAREHIASADSEVYFTAPNYNIRTTSKLEWYIVTEPDKALIELLLDDWPEGGGHTPLELGFRHVHAADSPFFKSRIDDVNLRLAKVGDEVPLSYELFVALRMYTGPCYCKYNVLLRGAFPDLTNDFFRGYIKSNCRGNQYTTTLMNLCLGITKLCKVTQAQTVYRAPGGNLPPTFFKSALDGSCGGLELGFMSTTTEKDEAIKYAAMSGVNVIFEVHQGMVARGAEIAWLSQFPTEAEVLFGPLTVCEVQHIRIEGAFTIIELRPSLTPHAERAHTAMESDMRVCDVVDMLRADKDGSVMHRINAGVKSLGGGEPASTKNLEMSGIVDFAKMNHSRMVLLTMTAKEVARFAEAQADAYEAELEKPGAKHIELKALAAETRLKVYNANKEVNRLLEAEAQAKAQLTAVEGFKVYTLEEKRKRKEKTKGRFNLMRAATSANLVRDTMSPQAIADRAKKKQATPGWGFP